MISAVIYNKLATSLPMNTFTKKRKLKNSKKADINHKYQDFSEMNSSPI